MNDNKFNEITEESSKLVESCNDETLSACFINICLNYTGIIMPTAKSSGISQDFETLAYKIANLGIRFMFLTIQN